MSTVARRHTALGVTTQLVIGVPKKLHNSIISDISMIIIASFIVKIFLYILHGDISFIDHYDQSIYLQYTLPIFDGKLPYVHYPVEWPQLLFIPSILATLCVLATENTNVFFTVFTIEMVVFDALTACFIYLIGRKIYDEFRARSAAIIYCFAFGTGYFVLTKYDAFPALLLVIGLAMYVYSRDVMAYGSITMGVFAKWFPAVSIPFMLLHDIKNNSNIIHTLKLPVVLALIITIPFLILNFHGFVASYTFHSGRPAEAPSLLFLLGGIPSWVYPGLVVIALAFLVYKFNAAPCLTRVDVIYYSSMLLAIVVILNPVFSPQYSLWIAPLIALLLSDTISHASLFFAHQIMVFLEFPLLYRIIYVNGEYFSIFANVFFIVKFVILTAIIVVLYRNYIARTNTDVNYT